MLGSPKVVSIAGHPYVLPHLVDRRGRQVSFVARMTDGSHAIVVGEKIVFDLILHRMPGEGGAPMPQDQWARLWNRWCISDPESGMLVAKGGTRQDALDALAQRIAYEGGNEAFEAAVREAVIATLDQVRK